MDNEPFSLFCQLFILVLLFLYDNTIPNASKTSYVFNNTIKGRSIGFQPPVDVASGRSKEKVLLFLVLFDCVTPPPPPNVGEGSGRGM